MGLDMAESKNWEQEKNKLLLFRFFCDGGIFGLKQMPTVKRREPKTDR